MAGALVAVTLLVIAGVYIVGAMNRVRVPDVQGLTQQEALSQLQDSGLSPVVDAKPDGSVEAGRVIGTDPAAGGSVSSGVTSPSTCRPGPSSVASRMFPDCPTTRR